MSASIDPPAAPAHQCLNVVCGCDDQVSAGPCSAWCAAHTVEAADIELGTVTAVTRCECGHGTCGANRGSRGTPSRGLS